MVVTHDIDEAIKLADRVAIMNVGGVLEQYATPDELLGAPANAFVASFLGRERGLRRLALRTVADIAPIAGPAVTPHATARGGTRRDGPLRHAVGGGRRRRAAVRVDRARGGQPSCSAPTIDALPREDFVSQVSPTTPLREALDVIVNARSRMAVVVDRGCTRGR